MTETTASSSQPTPPAAVLSTDSPVDPAATELPAGPPADEVRISIAVAADKSSAHLSLVSPAGAPMVTREQLFAALEAAGVVYGIKPVAIASARASGQADAMLVAEGTPPVDGRDASFLPLVAELKHRAPKADEHGTVDFRDLGLFFSVKAGTPLMRRTPATAAVPGRNVLGEAVPAKPGNDPPFAPMIRGASPDPNDANLLLASITGQPVLVTHGVAVEPTLTLQTVDLSTGHIDFEGSVTVLGDVRSGMRVHAAGDVTVGGVVEAADIQAKGDITIKGGVIGHGEWGDTPAQRSDTARVSCDGSVHTLFAENAWIEAGGCIFIHDAARQTHLSAINKVVVGKEDGSTGQIIGGRAQATLLVQAAVVGSAAGVRTRLEVGVNPKLADKLEALHARRQQLDKELADITRLLTFARANPKRIGADMLEKAERTAAKLVQDITTCCDEAVVFQTQMGLADNAACIVGRKVYGGVQVRVGAQACDIEDEQGRGAFRVVDDKLCYTRA